MIRLQIVNGTYVYVNPDHIEVVEGCAENNTVVRIHDSTSYVVAETPEQIVADIAAWYAQMHRAGKDAA
jgi:uncharacterized protein YlzI (FlbEa/FlbD family)